MGFLLALDQGTTSSRAILFDSEGRIVAVDQQEFPQIYPQPGWVEHDPEAIWESQLGVARSVLGKSGIPSAEVAAIGIANQRETTVVWERATGRPIYNAIVWQDRRTDDHCERLGSDGLEDVVRYKTGLLLDPYFSATKIRWILDHVPDARQLAERGELAFGTVDSWLLYRASGVHATDPSNASRTLLFNIHMLDWDEDLLSKFGVPRAMLPEVRPSSGFFGEAKLLDGMIPVLGVAGDQQAASFGQACFHPGMVKNTYGTGSFLLMNTGHEPKASQNRLLSTVAWQVGNATDYALEGSVFVTGAAIQWLRDELQIINSAADSESAASLVPDSAGVYFVPAFTGLGAPHWDANARGAIVGLTRGTGRRHITRAALESACFQTREVIEAMQADCGVDLTDLRVDGGMTANNLLLQMQADLLGIPVHRPKITETTALGAAYLAGLAAGMWPDTNAIQQQWQIDRTFEPRMSSDQREQLYAGWKQAVRAVRQFSSGPGD